MARITIAPIANSEGGLSAAGRKKEKEKHVMKSQLFRSIGKALVAVGILGTFGFFAGRIAVAKTYARDSATLKPFYLERETYSFRVGRVLSRSVLARRSDGATVRLETAFGRPGLALNVMSRVVTSSSGRKTVFGDWIKTKTTWPEPTPQAQARRLAILQNPAVNCAGAEESVVGSEVVLDHRSIMVRSAPFDGPPKTHDSPPEKLIETAWRMPDFACQEIQKLIEGLRSDGTVERIVLNRPLVLSLGEPDPHLFDDGVSYAEQGPAEFVRRSASHFGFVLDTAAQSAAENEEKRYRASVRKAERRLDNPQ